MQVQDRTRVWAGNWSARRGEKLWSGLRIAIEPANVEVDAIVELKEERCVEPLQQVPTHKEVATYRY